MTLNPGDKIVTNKDLGLMGLSNVAVPKGTKGEIYKDEKVIAGASLYCRFENGAVTVAYGLEDCVDAIPDKNDVREAERLKFIERITHSVGYVESDNKKEFLKGVSVAFDWLSDDFDKIIEQKDSNIKGYKASSDFYRKDLKTICDIIQSHSDE